MPMYEFKCIVCGSKKTCFKTVATRDDNPPECYNCEFPSDMQRVVFPHQFISPDIEPYRAMGPDRPWITSRSEHREYLYKHGYTEVGNDSSFAPPEDDSHPSELQPQLAKDLEQVYSAPSLD